MSVSEETLSNLMTIKLLLLVYQRTRSYDKNADGAISDFYEYQSRSGGSLVVIRLCDWTSNY